MSSLELNYTYSGLETDRLYKIIQYLSDLDKLKAENNHLIKTIYILKSLILRATSDKYKADRRIRKLLNRIEYIKDKHNIETDEESNHPSDKEDIPDPEEFVDNDEDDTPYYTYNRELEKKHLEEMCFKCEPDVNILQKNHISTGICDCVKDFLNNLTISNKSKYEEFFIDNKTNTTKYHYLKMPQGIIIECRLIKYDKPNAKINAPRQKIIGNKSKDDILIDLLNNTNKKNTKQQKIPCIGITETNDKKNDKPCLLAWCYENINLTDNFPEFNKEQCRYIEYAFVQNNILFPSTI